MKLTKEVKKQIDDWFDKTSPEELWEISKKLGMVRDVYTIEYPELGISQTKILISDEEYRTVIVPAEITKHEIECIPKKDRSNKQKAKLKECKDLIKNYGEYFTDKSPIYLSKGHILLPFNSEMFNHKIKVTVHDNT